MGILSAPFWCVYQKLSLSLLHFNKTLLHKSSKWSSLIFDSVLNSCPPEAKNPSIFRGSATAFQSEVGGEIEKRREWLPRWTVEGAKVFPCLVRYNYQQGINMDRETSLGVQRIRWECCCFPFHLCPGCFLGSWAGPPPSRAPSV